MKKQKIKILFRVAGGKAKKKELGLGHVYRSANLASEFRKNEVMFLLEDFGGARKILNAYGFKNIISLAKGIQIKSDIEKTINVVKKNKIDILIIDKYLVKTHYVNKVRKHVKTTLISDLKNINYDVNLLINGFIGFKNKTIKNKFGTKCLLGPKYQILNNQFAKKIVKTKKQYKVLVTFGGFDEKNLTKIFLETFRNMKKPIKTKIILGPSTSKSEIKKLSTKIKKNLIVVDKTKNMFKDMTKAEFGICSGGLTTYEFASLGIPFVIICQNKHQVLTAKQWEHRRDTINLGLPNIKTPKKLEKILNNVCSKKFKPRNKTIVDGLGSYRVKSEIIKMADKI